MGIVHSIAFISMGIKAVGPAFVVMSAADVADVQSHAWLSVNRVLNSDLSARRKACVDAAIDTAEQIAAKRIIRFIGVLKKI